MNISFFFFFQAEDGIRDYKVTGVQTCALPIYRERPPHRGRGARASRIRPDEAVRISLSPLAVEVWRGGAQGAFQSFEVPRYPSQTVLDIVTYIQRYLDPTLAYRFACRVAMCGSGGVSVHR